MHSADFYDYSSVNEAIVYHICGIIMILEELAIYARDSSC